MTSINQADDANALQQLIQNLCELDPAIQIAAIRRSVLFKDKAPLGPLLHTLNNSRADNVRTAGAEAIEALKPWITDEQWLETLQKYNGYPLSHAALQLLQAIGKDVPLKPFLSKFALKNPYVLHFSHSIFRTAMAYWSPEKRDRLIQFSLERLQHTNADERIIAIKMLDTLNAKIPIEILLSALNDSEASIRKTVLDQLTELGKQEQELPIEPLATLLHDPDPKVRRECIRALGTQGKRAPVELFITAMRDTDQHVINEAASGLGDLGNIETIPILLEYLLTEPDSPWRDDNYSVLTTLDAHNEHIPLEPLLKGLHSETKEVRYKAIRLLCLLKERTPVGLLIKLLDHKDPVTRRHTVLALSDQLERISIEIIVNKLKDRNKEVRKAARLALGISDADIPLELLLPLLDGQEIIAREAAVRLAGKRMPLSRLMHMVHDHNWTVRVAAINVLSALGKQVPLDVFLEALCDRNLNVRRAAIIALGEQGERAPVTIIIGALRDRRRVSNAALDVLKKLGKRVPREWLLQALADPMAYIRVMAIQLLQEIEYEESFPVEAIRPMMQDSNAQVRKTAIQALSKSGAMEPIEPFIAALNDIDCSVCEAALHALTDKHIALPAEPIKALLGNRKTYSDAIVCLQQSHPEVLREVAEEAVNILLRKGSGQVLGSQVQEYTIEVIENMNNPGPLLVRKLVELLDWPYGRVHIRAEQALRKLGIEPAR